MITDEELIYIIQDIFDHLRKYGNSVDTIRWYAGLTNNPGKNENLQKNNGKIEHFKSWNLRNNETAKSLKRYLHEKGFKNGKSGVNLFSTLKSMMNAPTILYIYRMNN